MNRFAWISDLRVIASFLVVLLHVNALFFWENTTLSILNQAAVISYDVIARPCVPLFFMISGFLLLRKTEPISVFLSKRSIKIIPAFIFWTIFYLGMSLYQNSETITLDKVTNLLFQPAWFHLWFLYSLIILYLYTPVLRSMLSNSNKETGWYFFFIWFIAASIIPIMERLFDQTSIVSNELFVGNVGYFIAGYLFGSLSLSRKKGLFIVITTFGLLLLILGLEFFLTLKNSEVHRGFITSDFSPLIIFFNICLFVSFTSFTRNTNTSSKLNLFSFFLNNLEKASFGVFLIHPLIISILLFIIGTETRNQSSPIVFVPVLTLCVICISTVIIRCLQTINIGKIIAPE